MRKNRVAHQILIGILILFVVGLLAIRWFSVSHNFGPSLRGRHKSEQTRQFPNGGESCDRESADRSEKAKPTSAACESIGFRCSSDYFVKWVEPTMGSCAVIMHDGYPIPDPHCTPGGFDPTVSTETLRNRDWRTGCIRNCESSESDKELTYEWYKISKPAANRGKSQTCELDHLVPLELGGADGLGNIWPQCGPEDVAFADRYFKKKDRVENYLAREVKAGRMQLRDAQRGIAEDWTQYIPKVSRLGKAK